MINTDMRFYDFYTYGEANGYGQAQLSEEAQGAVKMAINSITTNTKDSILYKDATYLGLTYFLLDDSYVIQYGEEKLKVLYVIPKGRLKQVYLKNI